MTAMFLVQILNLTKKMLTSLLLDLSKFFFLYLKKTYSSKRKYCFGPVPNETSLVQFSPKKDFKCPKRKRVLL